MKVWYLVFQPDSLTYTLAKSLSYGGHSIWVWVVDPEYGAKRQDKIQRRVAEIPNVQILKADETELPPVIERLIVQIFPRPMESLRQVAPVARRARHISLVTAGDRSRGWRDTIKLQWAEAREFLSYMDRIDRVLYKDGFYRVDLYSLIKSRRMVGFDVHSQFLHDEGAFRVIHAQDWKPESPRPILANFLGSRDPQARKRVLDTVRPLFQSENCGSSAAERKKTMYWHEYSDANPSGIDPGRFLDVLTQSDFTLCPRGYSLVTHRPMEAMLRGSIPVLSADELDLYAMELEDGVNCVAVPSNQWPQTIRRLACLKERDIVAMRRNIDGMLNNHLRYDAASARMRARLGVTAPAERSS